MKKFWTAVALALCLALAACGGDGDKQPVVHTSAYYQRWFQDGENMATYTQRRYEGATNSFPHRASYSTFCIAQGQRRQVWIAPYDGGHWQSHKTNEVDDPSCPPPN